MIRRTFTAAALAAAALLPAGAALAVDGPSQPVRHSLAAPGPPVGDAAGIALARLANSYYVKPARMAIEMRAPVDPGVMIIRGILVHGRSHAAVGTFAFGPVRLRFVQTPSGFFTRLPGERCWRRDPEGMGDNSPFIAMRGSRFFAPQPGEASSLRTLETPPKIPIPKPLCPVGD